MALFQDLPPELLIAILETLIDNAHPRDHSHILKAIMIVSKEWQAIVKSTRSLWCTVSSEDPPSWVQQVLRNGEPDGPLKVRFLRSHMKESWVRAGEDLIIPVRNRWTDLRIEGSDFRHASMLTVSAPRLRSLSIFSMRFDRMSAHLAEQFPLLQSLSLDRVEVPWNWFRSKSLRHLFISNMPMYTLSIRVLLKILTSCPNLVLLSILGLALSAASIADDPPAIVTGLSHIDLRLDIEYATTLLERLQLSDDVKYSVIVYGATGPTWKRLEDILILPLTRFIKQISTSNDPRVALRNSKTGWTINVSSGGFMLEIPAEMDPGPILSLLGDLPVAVVYDGAGAVASGMPAQLSLSKIDGLLQNNVTHLRLLPDCPDFFSILTALSRPPTEETRMFPELRVLDIEQAGFNPTELAFRLTSLLEARQSTGHSLVIRFRCTNVELKGNDGLQGLHQRFSDSFVFRDDGHEMEWWEKPDTPLDPNHEELS